MPTLTQLNEWAPSNPPSVMLVALDQRGINEMDAPLPPDEMAKELKKLYPFERRQLHIREHEEYAQPKTRADKWLKRHQNNET